MFSRYGLVQVDLFGQAKVSKDASHIDAQECPFGFWVKQLVVRFWLHSVQKGYTVTHFISATLHSFRPRLTGAAY
jgi:hypothetical protein